MQLIKAPEDDKETTCSWWESVNKMPDRADGKRPNEEYVMLVGPGFHKAMNEYINRMWQASAPREN